MKLFPYLLLLSILFLACDDNVNSNGVEDLASVEVTIQAKYGNTDFVINDVYDYNGDQIRISNFQFFVSELSLGRDDDGSEIDEIEFVDFSQITNATLAAEGLSIASNSNVPVGNYPGVNLGIGVIPDLNMVTPDQFAPSHPLSNTANYWEDWNSYIFMKLEGTMDTDNDGIFDDVSFVYHVGSDPTYEQINITKGINLAKDEAMGLVIELDIEQLFVRDGSYLDIEANPRIHSIDAIETGHYLMDNFANALSIN